MSALEVTGRTVDEAVKTALTTLGIRKDNAVIDVLDEPSQGLLGLIGNRNARVMVSAKYDPAEYLEVYISALLGHMNIDGSIEIEEDDEKISGMVYGRGVGVLIGRRGKTLSDLQYLVNIIMRRQFAALNKMIVLDVENYRVRREKTLVQLAQNVARKVKDSGREQALEPMTPQERRIIHLALQEQPGITTYSTGDEPYRKVIVSLD